MMKLKKAIPSKTKVVPKKPPTITEGVRFVAKTLGCKPIEVQGTDLVFAKEVDKAIQTAATYAMHIERHRIRKAILIRFGHSKTKSVAETLLKDVLNDLEGPISGAPDKGAIVP
jgi:hypothetical protein